MAVAQADHAPPVISRDEFDVAAMPRLDSALSRATWDATLRQMRGNLLQSWQWGDFKQRQGWRVERLQGNHQTGRWMAQVLFRHAGPISLAYIPCGPTLTGNHVAVFEEMVAEIDAVCREHRAVTLIVEPNQRFELPGTFRTNGFVKWPTPFQPRLTLQVPMRQDDDMLKAMRKDTRANVRAAVAQDIAVERVPTTEPAMATFHAMMSEVSDRKGNSLLPLGYLTDLVDTFGDDATLFFASLDGEPIASALFLRFGDEVTCFSSGSVAHLRGRGATAYLRYQAMRWFREQGCRVLDLGNVQPEGLRTFKSGFGGTITDHPPAMERRYRPLASWFVRRALALRGGV